MDAHESHNETREERKARKRAEKEAKKQRAEADPVWGAAWEKRRAGKKEKRNKRKEDLEAAVGDGAHGTVIGIPDGQKKGVATEVSDKAAWSGLGNLYQLADIDWSSLSATSAAPPSIAGQSQTAIFTIKAGAHVSCFAPPFAARKFDLIFTPLLRRLGNVPVFLGRLGRAISGETQDDELFEAADVKLLSLAVDGGLDGSLQLMSFWAEQFHTSVTSDDQRKGQHQQVAPSHQAACNDDLRIVRIANKWDVLTSESLPLPDTAPFYQIIMAFPTAPNVNGATTRIEIEGPSGQIFTMTLKEKATVLIGAEYAVRREEMVDGVENEIQIIRRWIDGSLS